MAYGQRSRGHRFSSITFARNQEFDLSNLHTRGQRPKAMALQNVYIATLFDPRFDKSDGLSKEVKEVWVRQE